MNVLQVYKDYFPPVRGGIEGHINLLARGLKQRHVHVDVLVSNTNPSLSIESIDDITVTKVPQLGRIASAPINYNLHAWIKELGKRADIVHFHLPNPTAVISYFLSGVRKTTVVTYHSDIVRQRRLGALFQPILLHFLTQADAIIATSPVYVQSSKILSKFRQKCRLVPLGVDLSRFDGKSEGELSAAAIRKLHGERLLLFIGKFRYYKGLHILIEAMKDVEAKLLLIGEGYQEHELRRQVHSSGLDGKIRFLGELSDEATSAYLKACDVFVLPSVMRSEAFGVVLLEAMACGRPVISTDLGTGTSFVNEHQKTGLVIPPNDAKALARAITHLLECPELGDTYGRTGQQRVQSQFSANKMVDGIVEVYRSCLPDRSP